MFLYKVKVCSCLSQEKICIRLITYLLEDLSRKLSMLLKLSPAFNHHQREDWFLSLFFMKDSYSLIHTHILLYFLGH